MADRRLERMRVDTESDWVMRMLRTMRRVDGHSPLTPMQKRALWCASEGMREAETAACLGIARPTVVVHLRAARLRLGAGSSTTLAVATAIRRGLI